MRFNGLLTILLLLLSQQSRAEVYLAPDLFLQQAFAPQAVPKAKKLWLSGDLADGIEAILGHRYPKARLRYWASDDHSAWILDEVGKEEPITVGVLIKGGQIERLQVLIFRESRGWEVRHAFFSDQFDGEQLDSEGQLSQPIDGISGATLSVRAVSKLARVALWLDQKLSGQ